MNELSKLFRDIAGQARGYDVSASALRVARRRRNLRRIAPIVLPLLLVALIAGVWLPLHRAEAPSTNPLFWLPSRIAAPDASTPDLPTDRAVGVAALVYTPCPQDCWRVVVLRDGTQYRLASPGSQPVHRLSAGLSPDGRWVAYPDAKGDLMLRDLTGRTVVTFPDMRPRAWSPGGRYLALVPVNYRSPPPVTIVDLTTAAAIRTLSMQAPKAGYAMDMAGILDSGELIWVTSEFANIAPPDLTSVPQIPLPKSAQVQITDPGGRQVLHQWALQAPAGSGYMAPTSAIISMLDGRLLVRFTVAYAWGTAAGPADIVDATTGAVLTHYAVPAAAGPFDIWGAAGLADGRLLVVRARAKQPQVALLEHTNGKPQTISEVEGGYGTLILPGNAY